MHEREEETIHLLEGQLEVTLGDEAVILGPGDTIVLPRMTPHRLATAGTGNARYIVVCTPAGFDDFVLACERTDDGQWPPAAPSPDEIANLAAQAPKFGIALLAPPPR